MPTYFIPYKKASLITADGASHYCRQGIVLRLREACNGAHLPSDTLNVTTQRNQRNNCCVALLRLRQVASIIAVKVA